VTLDDHEWNHINDVRDAVAILTTNKVHHTLGINTERMLPEHWALTQSWLDQGYTEAASHTRNHTCSDSAYQSIGGYTYQISGSRDDIINNLRLPSPHVPAFVQPCGFESNAVRSAVAAANYLVDRHTGTSDFFAPWRSDGLYEAIGYSLTTWNWPAGGSSYERDRANSRFNTVYNAGGIYHLMDHPWQNFWTDGPYLTQHVQYIAGRKDVWYAGFGQLYQYHFVQERGQLSVTQTD
jgi:hypothetical protein